MVVNMIRLTMVKATGFSRQRQEELEQQRLEELERQRFEEERRRIEEIQNRSRNALDQARNNAENASRSEGTSFSLDGRTPQALPKPEYNYQVEGIVVVEVTVDRNGNVTSATPGVKGSTTLDEFLMSAAKKAALAAKFNRKPEAPAFQKGTITYHFIIE